MNVLLPVLLAAAGIAPSKPPAQTYRVLSQTYTIDRKYRSMEGPSSVQRITLAEGGTPELLWITGIRTEMVGEDGTTPQLPELMCHVNVDLDANYHQALFDAQRPVASRLITLSQGMLSARVPPGFGFPIASNEPLMLFTQVLNLNIEKPNNMKVRHRVTIDYVRDRDLTTPMKPLFNVGASGTVQLDNNPLALASMATSPDAAAGGATHNGTSCLIGARAPNATASSADYVDPQGRHMTGHWIVPPGRQVNRSDVTWFMNLTFDTRLHYAAVHLHPFASELIFRDATTNSEIFRSKATNPMVGIGLTRVERFTSPEGVPLYKSHKYEIVSVYDNPTKENADSMASVFLGLDDVEFIKPTPAQLTSRWSLLKADTYALRTAAGSATVTLARDQAPQTAIQFARLLGGGALAGAKVTRTEGSFHIAIPLTPAVQRLLQPIRENGAPHHAGTISYCGPGEGNEIILSVATMHDRDVRCTAFGWVDGLQVLTASPLISAEAVAHAANAMASR